jgi:hypothetical protein
LPEVFQALVIRAEIVVNVTQADRRRLEAIVSDQDFEVRRRHLDAAGGGAARRCVDREPKFWSCCFRRALNEIAAIAGFSTRPTRAALPERCALQVAAVVASARPAS